MRLNMAEEIDKLSEADFVKVRIEHNWVVITHPALEKYKADMLLYAGANPDKFEEILEKAHKDISKLVPKIITDSIGRTKTVYVKPSDAIKHAEKSEGNEHAEA